MKKAAILLFSILFVSFQAFPQTKTPLKHSDYDHWKNLSNVQFSDDGRWVCYEINPQKGDGFLYFYDVQNRRTDSVPRAYRAKISPLSDFITFQIKTQADTVRKATLDKVKKDKMPKDSLGIWYFSEKRLEKFPRVKSFKMAKEESNWLAINFEKALPVKDTTTVDTTASDTTKTAEVKKDKKKKKEEPKGTELMILKPGSDLSYTFASVTDYTMSDNGKLISFISNTKDSIEKVIINLFNTSNQKQTPILDDECTLEKLSLDKNGEQLAFLMSKDTSENKAYELYMWNKADSFIRIVEKNNPALTEGWCPSQNGNLTFSEDGKRLYFGMAEIPEEEPKDTLTADEKVSLDIWNWKDQKLQPMQILEAKREKKRTYTAVYHLSDGTLVQLENEELKNINYNRKSKGTYGLGVISDHYYKYQSWEGKRYGDVYLKNQYNGETINIKDSLDAYPQLSFGEKFIYWFSNASKRWVAYDIEEKTERTIGTDIPYQLTDEEHDMPNDANSYGIAGITENDEFILIYDRFDIWKVDLKGQKESVCLTNGYGRENTIKFRRKRLDPDETSLDLKGEMLLYAFNETTKASGFYRLNNAKKASVPSQLIYEDNSFSSYVFPKKAKDADLILWTQQNFNCYPDIWLSNMDFENATKVSHTNPQQNMYKWGTVEVVSWTSFDGIELEGLLYKPEDFDPNKKYPMIVYFYETYSDRLYSHHTPKPSRSTVNFTYYVSNDYLIFVPDIVYKTGYPGQSAYKAIVSGTMYLAEKYPWVNKEKLGLQGQSWGGYQTAYLVTQTNLYAAAMAGAPVSNMTSAYGGIRWGSGMSRMFQYEHTQSRIGGTLWEKPWHYIENSPVFYADKVDTPLLIMHNDNDGAVPWYQGIEYFVALRRLGQPVWMLTYNGAPHNLRRRADSQDLSLRMSQFFDHYLKDEPAPVWMEYGVPAVKKGKEFGFELIK